MRMKPQDMFSAHKELIGFPETILSLWKIDSGQNRGLHMSKVKTGLQHKTSSREENTVNNLKWRSTIYRASRVG